MVRRVLCLAGLVACQRAPAPTTAPGPDVAEVPRPASIEAAPSQEPTPSDSTPPVAAAVRVEEGWVRRTDDPSAPVLQLEHADDYGASGTVVVDAIVGSASEILSCWEIAVAAGAKRGSVSIQVRAPREPDDDRLWVGVAQDAGPQVQRCVDAALREDVPTPDEDDVAAVGFTLFSRRDEVVMRMLDPGGEVAVRAGGSCWQWREEPPCPPRKRCYASRWIRTSCGVPAMRDDASMHFGLGTPKEGKAPLVDMRLVGGDGTVLWRTPLASEFAAAYGEYEVPKAGSFAAATSAYAVEFGRDTVAVADPAGLQIYGRADGKRLLSWAAPERGEPTLWFDDGKFVIRRGKTVCEGDARHGSWYAECGDRMVYFDGYSLAVFRLSTPELIATRHLGQGKNRLTGHAPIPSAKLSAGGVQVEVHGNVYMN